MRFGDLLRGGRDEKAGPATSADIRQALERAEAAAADASRRLDTLTSARAAALIEDNDKELDRIEVETTSVRRDLDRAELAAEELKRRLEETLVAEEQARLDGLHDRAAAARDRIAELIRNKYVQLAGEMAALMLEIEQLDEVVLVNNRKLLEEHRSPVAHGEEVIAPHRRPRVAIYDVLRLPDPNDSGGDLLWPPDRFAEASSRFARTIDAAYAKARGES